MRIGGRLVTRITVQCLLAAGVAESQEPPPAYRTRPSQCRHDAPPGQALSTRRTETPIRTFGYTAEQVLTLSGDAREVRGGDVLVCTEYGNVEITDSDDDQVRLQIRVEGFGEGAPDPAHAARRVIEDTQLHAFMTAHQGQLLVRVWHSSLGFTLPGAQPAWVSVRLHLPTSGAYRVRTEAFHGVVAVRRLTLAAATLRGNVGFKLKGIPGFVGGTELDNVTLAGDVDIDNLIGLPGVRAPVPASLVPTAAPITIKARATSSARLTAVTGGNIDIAIQPAPDVGVRALAQSNTGRVRVGLDGGSAVVTEGDSVFRVRQHVVTTGYAEKRVRVDVQARSGPGNVNVVSVPAAPLHTTP